jgi:hypothetical protein
MRRLVLGLAWLFAVTAGCGTGSSGAQHNGAGGSGGASNGGNGGKAGSSNGGSAGSNAGGTSGSAGADSGVAGSSGTAGSGAGGGPTDSGASDITFTYDAPVGDGSTKDACATYTEKAQLAPLDMYIMLDNSGSMGLPTNHGACAGLGSGTKWCHAKAALNGFFATSNDGIALATFTGDNCTPLPAWPNVPLGDLPGHLTALDNYLNSVGPDADTPTMAAALGIAAYTSTHVQPGRKMIGILITDGDPDTTGCDDDPGDTTRRTTFRRS